MLLVRAKVPLLLCATDPIVSLGVGSFSWLLSSSHFSQASSCESLTVTPIVKGGDITQSMDGNFNTDVVVPSVTYAPPVITISPEERRRIDIGKQVVEGEFPILGNPTRPIVEDIYESPLVTLKTCKKKKKKKKKNNRAAYGTGIKK